MFRIEVLILLEENAMINGKKIIAFFSILFVLTACAQTQEVTKTKTAKGAGIGAVAGAATGAVIGSMAGQAGKGAVIGGIAGTAIGAVIGHELDKQEKELNQIPNTTVTREEDKLVVTLSDAILFDVNSAALKPPAMQTLDQMADVMVRYPDSDIIVAGHTDSTGSEKYNQDLSERRAKSVKNYLISKGVAAQRITAIGFGKTMPIASNDTPAGRGQNRRVEIEIKPRAGQPTG
jgi:outer membrane protein OmpA-like peptidoglycan-associated protein